MTDCPKEEINHSIKSTKDKLESLAKTIENITWRFKSKSKKFYFKSSAKTFFSLKDILLEQMMKEELIKSYFLGMNLLEWPYRVVWSKKIKGDVENPYLLTLIWNGMKIERIEGICP